MFDAFKYSRELEAVGFSRDQAELQLRMITEIVEGDLATKEDLQVVETTIRQDLKTAETGIRQDLKAVEAGIRQDLKTVETDIRQDLKAVEASIRQDLKTVETGIRHDMQTVETGIRQDMKSLELNLINTFEQKLGVVKNDMQQLEYRLTIKLGTFLLIGFTSMATLMKFWLGH